MHGHKRAEYKARLLDPKVAAGLQHKANQWFKLNDQVLAMSASGDAAKTTTETATETATATATAASTMKNLELLSNMLQVNPDPLYLWQRRRSLLQSLFQNEKVLDNDSDAATTSFDQYIYEELALTRKCLERNPKAYGAWFHRKWSVMEAIQQKAASSSSSSSSSTAASGGSSSLSLLQNELQLTEQFLNLDERNFHCWSYRRFVVGCLCGNTSGEIVLMDGSVLFGPQVGFSNQEHAQDDGKDRTPVLPTSQIQSLLNSEFDFTTFKIRQNFSNGSAFHYRSKLLPHVSSTESGHAVSLAEELELAHNAMFTEPDDQTAWWYYDFLLTKYTGPNDCPDTTAAADVDADSEAPDNDRGGMDRIDLQVEKELLEELIDAEGGHSKWALLALFHVLTYMVDDEDNQRELQQREILETLKVLDPDRRFRYQDMMQKKGNTG